jgi:hypothetical protein
VAVEAKPVSVAEARKRLAAQHAAALVASQAAGGSELARARAAAGMKAPKGPVTASYRNRLPDPTVVLDGDGKQVGDPSLPIVWVPKIHMSGDKGDGRINERTRLGYVPVKYRDGDRKGEVVESSFGVCMQPASAEVDAEFYIATHPTQGVNAKEFFEAQVAQLEQPGLMSIKAHDGDRRDWVEKKQESPL